MSERHRSMGRSTAPSRQAASSSKPPLSHPINPHSPRPPGPWLPVPVPLRRLLRSLCARWEGCGGELYFHLGFPLHCVLAPAPLHVCRHPNAPRPMRTDAGPSPPPRRHATGNRGRTCTLRTCIRPGPRVVGPPGAVIERARPKQRMLVIVVSLYEALARWPARSAFAALWI